MEKKLFDHPEEDELQHAPLLRSLKGSMPFHEPDGYFSTLGSHIQQRIHDNSVRTENVSFYRRPAFAVAGILAIALAFIFFNLNTENKKEDSLAHAEEAISCEDILESEYYLELDEDVIAIALASDAGTYTPNDTLSTGEIENYLIQNADELLFTSEL